jgi:hypothetical protein
VVIAILTGRGRNHAVAAKYAVLSGRRTDRARFELAGWRATVTQFLVAVVAFFLDQLTTFDNAVTACQTGLTWDRAGPFPVSFNLARGGTAVTGGFISVVTRFVTTNVGSFDDTISTCVTRSTSSNTDEASFLGAV